jgi:hypothetical protein
MDKWLAQGQKRFANGISVPDCLTHLKSYAKLTKIQICHYLTIRKRVTDMSFDDEFLKSEDESVENETGSDELLSDDHLRLPEGASPLVRLHAIRAWLVRRQQETSIEIGDAALTLQQLMEEEPQISRPRRRERLSMMERVQQAQQEMQNTQQRLKAYEEAQELLEDCITHTTPGERALVEYYLALEDAMQENDEETLTPHQQALMDVQHRVEHVSAPNEDE